MPLNTFEHKVEPPKDDDHGPTIHVWGSSFGKEFDERFECWAEIPAKASRTIDTIEFGGIEIPRADLIRTIEQMLVTKRPEEKFVALPDSENGEGEKVIEWVAADDAERWVAMIEGDDVQMPARKLGDIYRDLVEVYGERPT